MAKKNKHGLARDIPADIKRVVRQKCGFGCVVCGSAIYQYEHLDPLFSEAMFHNASGIVLLCGGCHDKVTRGLLSKDTVRRSALSPKAREMGFSFGAFDVGGAWPELVVGSIKAIKAQVLIEIDGEAILSVMPPLARGLPFRLNAFLCDEAGSLVLRIEENEWRSSVDNWDVTVQGSRITIKNAPRNDVLVLRSNPPNQLVVEKINMSHRGATIRCDESLELTVISGSGVTTVQMLGVTVEGCHTVFRIEQGAIMVGCGPREAQGPHPSKVGRNHPCPCGSSRKYKHCCGKVG